MDNSQHETPRLGQVVTILRGRDSGQNAVIVAIDSSRFVMLADGHKKTFARPKKKNIRHVRLEDYVDRGVVASLNERQHVTNAKLRHAIKQFQLTRPQEEEKGE